MIVLTDEALRSQYDTLALNMRNALPRALFGDYVSIYDFQQSVEDGATVPLFYENRTPELRLENPNLNDDIYALIEAAELDEEQERRLERQYHLLTRDHRLETVAKNVVKHFLGRGFQRKAMVSPSTKRQRFGCTTRCGSTGKPNGNGWRKSWRGEHAQAG